MFKNRVHGFIVVSFFTVMCVNVEVLASDATQKNDTPSDVMPSVVTPTPTTPPCVAAVVAPQPYVPASAGYCPAPAVGDVSSAVQAPAPGVGSRIGITRADINQFALRMKNNLPKVGIVENGNVHVLADLEGVVVAAGTWGAARTLRSWFEWRNWYKAGYSMQQLQKTILEDNHAAAQSVQPEISKPVLVANQPILDPVKKDLSNPSLLHSNPADAATCKPVATATKADREELPALMRNIKKVSHFRFIREISPAVAATASYMWWVSDKTKNPSQS